MTALITGGSGGIGFALAKVFAAHGYDLILVSRDSGNLTKASKELTDLYEVTVDLIVVDLTDDKAVESVHKRAMSLSPKIDILVNNAGFGNYGEFYKTETTTELSEIDLNVRALTHLTKLFVTAMVERGNGKILNVASVAAFMPGPYMAVYYATKAYVLSFSLALTAELVGKGITVSALCPGPTKTKFDTGAGISKSRLFKGKLPTADSVAQKAYKGLMREKAVITPGLTNKLTSFLTRFIPRRSLAMAVKRFQSYKK